MPCKTLAAMPVSHPSRRAALALLAGAAAAPFAARAGAPPWPTRPIRLVVPYAAAGRTNLAARLLAERLGAALGQPVVIANRPGAGSAIGVMEVVQARPDGHTLLLSGSDSFTLNPVVRPGLGYDPLRGLTPVAMVARAPLVLVTPAAGPHASLDALLADAARRPGAINYATFGPGSASRLAAELLCAARGVRLTPVAYRGRADASMALLRGEVGLGLEALPAAVPQLRAGKLRALAIDGTQRSPLLPGVPAFGERGLAQAVFDRWYAVAGPAGLPTPVVQRLEAALGQVLADPVVRRRLLRQSLEPVLLGSTRLRQVVAEDVDRYRAAVAQAGIRLG
jgi:tripartite-type tricarboxylate transporter receptor subunit TctC